MIFRILYNQLTDRSPPYVDNEYWQVHNPEDDPAPQSELDWWGKFTDSITQSKLCNDPLYIDVACAVILELEREYKRLRRLNHD